MQIKKSSGIFLWLLIVTAGLSALDIKVLYDDASHLSGKTVRIQFIFSPQEYGIVKNTLQFSSDRSDVALTSWRLSPLIRDVFVQPFKKNIRLIPRSCEGFLGFEYGNGTSSDVQPTNPQLIMSCLVAHQNGSIKPFLTTVPLVTRLSGLHDHATLSQRSLLTHPQRLSDNIKTIPGIPIVNLENDLEPLHHLQEWWERLMALMVAAIKKMYDGRWIMVILAFLGLCWLKHHVAWGWLVMPLSEHWERELRNASIFFLLIGGVYAARHVVDRASILYALAVLCSVGMLYTLLTAHNEETFLNRCKIVIGIMLGGMVLPLLLKGYMLSMGS